MPTLKTGLLWFDDDSTHSLEDKIHRAAIRYQEKYGRRPNVCYVHPTDFLVNVGNSLDLSDIEVYPLHSILRHHLWIGIVSRKEPKQNEKET